MTHYAISEQDRAMLIEFLGGNLVYNKARGPIELLMGLKPIDLTKEQKKEK